MEFTGERYVPELDWPEISYEHWHRYLFASQYTQGKAVLDIACGEGYGSYLLSMSGRQVVGVDISQATVQHARGKYSRDNLHFLAGSASRIPLGPEALFDVIVSFETIEHLTAEDQDAFMAEAKRLLKPDGVLIISTPNKSLYDARAMEPNEFHLKEFELDGFRAWLCHGFKHVDLLGQKVEIGSFISSLKDEKRQLAEFRLDFGEEGFRPTSEPRKPVYAVAVCSDQPREPAAASMAMDLSMKLLRMHQESASDLANRLRERDSQVHKQADRVRAQQAQLHEQREELHRLQTELHDKMIRIQGLSTELAEIHSSKAWSAVTTYRQMRALPAIVTMRIRSYVIRISRNGRRLMRSYGIRFIIREILSRAHQLVLVPIRERAGGRALAALLGRLGLSADPAMVLSRARETLPAPRYSLMLEDLLKINEAAAPTPDKEEFPIIRASDLPVLPGTRPRRRILFITSQFPSPFHGGGNRVLNFIKHLSRTNDIYLASAFSDPEDLPALQVAAPYCQSVFRISPWKFREMKAEIRKWLGGQTFDIVHYEWPRSLQNYDPGFGRHHIFTYMEAVSLRLLMDVNSMAADSEEWVGKVAELIEALRLEIVDTEPLDARIAVTTKDAEFLKDLNPRQEYTILNHGLTFADFVLPEVEPEPQTLVFVGNYLHYPNVDAMNYFFGGIWERIHTEVPGVRMYIVGTNPTPALLALGDREGVTVTGSVPDVRSYIQKASVCVAPLISGAGLRGKVIEYAALRRTFVATSIATTDLAFKDGRDYLCADTPDEFSQKVIDLLRNPELAAEMGSNAYETALGNYDTGRLADFLNRLYDRLEERS